uniref:Uncharacterized protein n=1 Tax=Glossina austeni TaxID=7395 RepID=A0A1A9V8H6_GLOAU
MIHYVCIQYSPRVPGNNQLSFGWTYSEPICRGPRQILPHHTRVSQDILSSQQFSPTSHVSQFSPTSHCGIDAGQNCWNIETLTRVALRRRCELLVPSSLSSFPRPPPVPREEKEKSEDGTSHITGIYHCG